MSANLHSQSDILEEYIKLLLNEYIRIYPNLFGDRLNTTHTQSADALLSPPAIVIGIIGEVLYDKIINTIKLFPNQFHTRIPDSGPDMYILNLITDVHQAIYEECRAKNKQTFT